MARVGIQAIAHGVRSYRGLFFGGGVVAAGFGGAAEFDVALVFELFEPAFDGSLRFVTSRNKCCCVQAGRLGNDHEQGFWTIYSAIYSDIYSLIYANGRCLWGWLRLE